MKHPQKAAGLIAYLAVWAFCVLWFWLGRSGGGWAMAYTILTYGAILPTATLVSAFLLERKQNLGLWRWASIGFFALMYGTAMLVTFVLGTALGAVKFAPPSPVVLLGGLIPAAVGTVFGWLVRTKRLSSCTAMLLLFLLLCVVYVRLKTLNGSLLRFLPILDLPALVLLLLLLWLPLKTKNTE